MACQAFGRRSARWVVVCALVVWLSSPAGAGEVLYNGIELPGVWPPRAGKLAREPMALPYLASPPAVISARAGHKGSGASGVCTTGLGLLRRDGFASMDAGDRECTLTTRPVRFRGKHLFVNADVPRGELRVEVLGEKGGVIEPFTRDACLPVRADGTLQAVTWKGADSLAPLAGRPVRLRFHLRHGRLYAFWVSAERSGASHGFVAAGGPGYTGPIDTVGAAALR